MVLSSTALVDLVGGWHECEWATFFSRQKLLLLLKVMKTAEKKNLQREGSSNEWTWTPLQNRNKKKFKIAKNKMLYQK